MAAKKPSQPPEHDIDREAQKELIKEALKEWLDAQWAAFGKWTARGVAALVFSALAYAWLNAHGWHH